jgi:hypothetical protein
MEDGERKYDDVMMSSGKLQPAKASFHKYDVGMVRESGTGQPIIGD